jgi:exo beta-1,2-glucooligosaccharide sophorohydrolase (non-reducing end)
MKYKTIFIPAFILILKVINCPAQSYQFFRDSKNPEYYENSWMDLTTPSELDRKGIDLRKFPIESIHVHQGINCLRMHWKSMAGGNWFAIAAGDNWTPQNISNSDSLIFWLYSAEGISPVNLPLLFLEDVNNAKSSFIDFSSYAGSLSDSVWYAVKIPMQAFFGAAQQIDWTQVKTIGFTQNTADTGYHTLLVDDMRIYKGNSYVAPLNKPVGLSAKGYDSHTRLTWNAVTDPRNRGYEIYLSADSGRTYEIRGIADSNATVYNDFVRDKGTNLDLCYKIDVLNEANIPSAFSDSVNVSTHNFTDDELLTMVEEATFRYFWDFAHPKCGIARERNSSGDIVTIGGSGFGVMAILVGIERGFITRQEGIDRMKKILGFLTAADRFHGAWPHWMDGRTGKTIPFTPPKDDGGDLLETALMMQGLLTVRQYFNGSDTSETHIANMITNLWNSVEWDWYRKDNGPVLYWHWSPDYDWQMNMPIQGWNECTIVYLLAIASPTHPVPASLWKSGWTSGQYYRNGKTFYGYPLDIGWDYGGPLFFTQFSFTGLDPHLLYDGATNYYENNKTISLINHEYSVQNPKGFAGYASNCWGISASDDPLVYYLAHEPNTDRDNGTLTPTAALSAFVYTPEYSMDALKHFYRDLGRRIWGDYGFYDAFNEQLDWYATSFLAVDEGPIIDMIENYRTGLLWNYFMMNPDIMRSLDSITNITGIPDNNVSREGLKLKIWPDPMQDFTTIQFDIQEPRVLSIYLEDISGKKIETIVDNKYFTRDTHSVTYKNTGLSNGVYLLNLTGKDIHIIKKLMVVR